MKLTSNQKKELHLLQIKLGKTSKKQRGYVWQYILHNSLDVGYADAIRLQAEGFQVLKPLPYFADQPN